MWSPDFIEGRINKRKGEVRKEGSKKKEGRKYLPNTVVLTSEVFPVVDQYYFQWEMADW